MVPAGRLLLNRRLIEAPVDAIDDVITHELCHIAEPGHGAAFHELLDRVLPDWQHRKQRLERIMARLLSIPVATDSDAASVEINLGMRNNSIKSGLCGKFTKSPQATGPENIGPERTLLGLLAPGPVNSFLRITPENNGKIRPRPDRESAFARASGGGNATAGEPVHNFILQLQ